MRLQHVYGGYSQGTQDSVWKCRRCSATVPPDSVQCTRCGSEDIVEQEIK